MDAVVGAGDGVEHARVFGDADDVHCRARDRSLGDRALENVAADARGVCVGGAGVGGGVGGVDVRLRKFAVLVREVGGFVGATRGGVSAVRIVAGVDLC